MFLQSRAPGTIVAADRYEVHDQPSWRVLFRLDADVAGAAPRETHLPEGSVPPNPQPGDRIQAQMVLGEAIEITAA